MSFTSICLTMLLIYPLIVEAKEFSCEPRQEIKDVQKLLNDESIPKEQRQKAIKALLEKFPDDIYAQEEYLLFVKYFDESSYDVALKRQKHLLDANPDDPIYLYLYAVVLKDKEEAIPYFERAMEKSPSSPQVYEYLALHYSWTKPDPEKLNGILRRWISACPSVLKPYEYVVSSDDKELVRQSAVNMRKVLLEKPQTEVASSYNQLWALEFLSKPVDQHDTVRAKVRTDLEKLSKDLARFSIEQLDNLKQGFEIVSDDKGVRRVEDEIVRLFPDSYEAADIISSRWSKDHPEPEGKDLTALEKWQKEHLAATKDWAKQWPKNSWMQWIRVTSMYEVENIPENEVLEAVDMVLQTLEEGHSPPQEFMIARILIDNNLRLDEVSKIIDQGVTKTQSDEFADVERQKLFETDMNWRADVLRTALALAKNQLNEGEKILTRMNDALLKPVSADDKKSSKIRASEYWSLLSEKAQKSGNKADALIYYRSALQAMPEKVNIRKKARILWGSLGGTTSGWNEFINFKTPDFAQVEFKEMNISFPEFLLSDLNGRAWQTSNFKDKVTFMNVWATWCGPCLRELPHVEKLYQELKEKEGVLFITLNVDENQGLVQPFLKKNGYTFPVISSAALINKIRPMYGIPINWILKDGVIIKEQTGFAAEDKSIWTDGMLKAILATRN